MSVQTRAYDDHHGDPVAVMVVTGNLHVSRLVALLARGNCEQVAHGDRLNRQLRRHNGGRAALALLKAHGGPDFTSSAGDRRLVEDALREERCAAPSCPCRMHSSVEAVADAVLVALDGAA